MSWGELFIALLVFAVIWYGYVLLRYYRGFLHRRNRTRPTPAARASFTKNKEAEPPPGDPHAQVHELLQELKLVFAAAARDHQSKEQVLEAIGALFANYPALPNDIKPSVAQHIASEFSLQCNISVTPEEINALW